MMKKSKIKKKRGEEEQYKEGREVKKSKIKKHDEEEKDT